MIISFNQSPESYLRLSESAFEKGDLVKALQYCEKSVEGMRSAQLFLAEIYLKMHRGKEAMDVLLQALAHGTDDKSKAFDLMAKATTASGKLYDSLFYVMGKAQMEGDDETLDAMDDIMDDLMDSFSDEERKPKLFLVGKEEKKRNHARETEQAMFYFSSDRFEEAAAIAAGVPESSDAYEDAQDILLRSEVRMGKTAEAESR